MRECFSNVARVSIGLIVLSALGCGSGGETKTGVSGVVTVAGKPVEGLLVAFVPEPGADGLAAGRPVIATTDAQGKFTIDAVVSKCKVTVQADDPEAESTEKAAKKVGIDPKFCDLTSTPLTVEIKDGMEELKIECGAGQ